MELRDLYGAVLLLVLIAIMIAVTLILLAGLGSSSTSVTTTANASINAFITAIGSIGTSWAGIIVLVIVAAIIIGLVVRSFGGGMQGNR